MSSNIHMHTCSHACTLTLTLEHTRHTLTCAHMCTLTSTLTQSLNTHTYSYTLPCTPTLTHTQTRKHICSLIHTHSHTQTQTDAAPRLLTLCNSFSPSLRQNEKLPPTAEEGSRASPVSCLLQGCECSSVSLQQGCGALCEH